MGGAAPELGADSRLAGGRRLRHAGLRGRLRLHRSADQGRSRGARVGAARRGVIASSRSRRRRAVTTQAFGSTNTLGRASRVCPSSRHCRAMWRRSSPTAWTRDRSRFTSFSSARSSCRRRRQGISMCLRARCSACATCRSTRSPPESRPTRGPTSSRSPSRPSGSPGSAALLRALGSTAGRTRPRRRRHGRSAGCAGGCRSAPARCRSGSDRSRR